MNDPFIQLVGVIRDQGQHGAPPGVDLGLVKSLNPITLECAGTLITQSIYAPPEMMRSDAPPFASGEWAADVNGLRAFIEQELQARRLKVGDVVAIKRIGEINVILNKVVGT